MNTTVGERGQVTIPKQIRDALHIVPGMELEVAEEHGVIVLRRPRISNALDKWAGTAENPFGTTDGFLMATRDELDPDAPAPQ